MSTRASVNPKVSALFSHFHQVPGPSKVYSPSSGTSYPGVDVTSNSSITNQLHCHCKAYLFYSSCCAKRKKIRCVHHLQCQGIVTCFFFCFLADVYILGKVKNVIVLFFFLLSFQKYLFNFCSDLPLALS